MPWFYCPWEPRLDAMRLLGLFSLDHTNLTRLVNGWFP